MTFYTMTFVGRVDDQGRPITSPHDGKPSVREVPIWDERNTDELRACYAAEGSLTVERLGSRRDPGRPLERKGPIVMFSPHLISLTIDRKAQFAQPDGPLPFEPRNR